jgi:hypothetical protein
MWEWPQSPYAPGRSLLQESLRLMSLSWGPSGQGTLSQHTCGWIMFLPGDRRGSTFGCIPHEAEVKPEAFGESQALSKMLSLPQTLQQLHLVARLRCRSPPLKTKTAVLVPGMKPL